MTVSKYQVGVWRKSNGRWTYAVCTGNGAVTENGEFASKDDATTDAAVHVAKLEQKDAHIAEPWLH